MTRELAEQRVSERWEYLKLNKAACPIMFGMDVDNMVEHPEDYIDVANQGKALQQGIESLRVGDDSGGASSVCAPVESLPVPLTGNGVSGDGELPQGRSVSIADADSRSLPRSSAQGKTGAGLHTSEHPAPAIFILAIDHFTFDIIRFVDERLSMHALAQIASKLPDLSLAEQYRLEEIEAASESGVQ